MSMLIPDEYLLKPENDIIPDRENDYIEVRNDNDPRFSAKMVQEFFLKNHLNQVFTQPYTPQENGHIESFHAILGRSLEPKFSQPRTIRRSSCSVLHEI